MLHNHLSRSFYSGIHSEQPGATGIHVIANTVTDPSMVGVVGHGGIMLDGAVRPSSQSHLLFKANRVLFTGRGRGVGIGVNTAQFVSILNNRVRNAPGECIAWTGKPLPRRCQSRQRMPSLGPALLCRTRTG